jgi:hypothetical protein
MVVGGGKEAKFHLNCPSGPPTLRENYGFNRAELSDILAELEKTIGKLCEEWRRIHGNL